MRMLKWTVWTLLLALVACASSGPKMTELEKLQYAYSAAIRWGDFEGAWQLVDPKYREAHPISEIEFSRYEQIQISAYRDLATNTSLDAGTSIREIQIGVVNKNNMTERGLRYTERWAYDPVAKVWWLQVGLPDLWQGQ